MSKFALGEKVIHKGVPGIVRCITHSYTIIDLEDGRTVWIHGGTHE